MAKAMSFEARWGAPCGRRFDTSVFLLHHPQFEWLRELMPNRETYPWTTIKAGM
jgi:hypothetical protein